MKRLSLLSLMLTVALVASAAFPVSRPVYRNKLTPSVTQTTNVEETKSREANRAGKAEPARVISEQPEGEVVFYSRTGNCIYSADGYLNVGEQSETGTIKMVYADDNKVYIQNILSGAGDYYGDAWVEGTISEDGAKLLVPLGQSIYWSDRYEADVVLAWGSTSVIDNSISFAVDNTVENAEFAIDTEAKTITLLNSDGVAELSEEFSASDFEATGLGCYWTDDNSFGGCLDWFTEFTETEPIEAPTLISEQPEGELTTYMRSGYCISSGWNGIGMYNQDGKLSVVIGTGENQGKAFIKNPIWWNDTYDTWVEGDYNAEDGTITIPVGQFISWNDQYEYGVQVFWGKSSITTGLDDNGEEGYYFNYEILDDVENIVFQIEDDVITLLNCEGDPEAEFPDNYVVTGMIGVWSDDLSMTAIEYYTEGVVLNLVPVVPADPVVTEWYDCGDESGFSRLYFTLPTTDVDGNPIDPDYLSYSVFTDGELFTFPAEDYTYDLTEDITEVPYELYSGAVDFKSSYIYFYRTNTGDNPLFKEKIGLQVYYTVDGVKNSSSIVYLGSQTGIKDINAAVKADGPIYNIMGQKMSGELPAGIYFQNGKKFVVK